MKNLINLLAQILLWFAIASCAKTQPPSPGDTCSGTTGTGVVGSDGLCYSCLNGGTATYDATSGYCGYPNSAGVSCCGSYSGNYLVCDKPGYPYLCSNGLCYSGLQSNMTCVYNP